MERVAAVAAAGSRGVGLFPGWRALRGGPVSPGWADQISTRAQLLRREVWRPASAGPLSVALGCALRAAWVEANRCGGGAWCGFKMARRRNGAERAAMSIPEMSLLLLTLQAA